MNKWEDIFFIDKEAYQIDWGDHPRTGDWAEAWIVKRIPDGVKVSNRRYSQHIGARRGAAQIFNHMMKTVEKELLGR